MSEEVKELSIPHYEVDHKLIEMAQQILAMRGDDKHLCLIGIMKGGLWTLYRLVEELRQQQNTSLDYTVTLGHIGFSSYNEMMHASEMRCTYPLDLYPEHLDGKHVWLIDDIYDTGATMQAARQKVRNILPSSCTLNMATLVTKHPNIPEVHGFVIEQNQFVVGCGMGLGERYRSRSDIHTANHKGAKHV